MTRPRSRPASRQVAMVTGASRGLGAVVAQFLAGQEFDLVLTARGGSALREFARTLSLDGIRVAALSGDVADPAHRRRLVRAAAAFGRLDLLLNNASTLGASPLPALAGNPLPTLEDVFRTNTIAPLGLVQDALPLLRKSHGLVVNISSDAAVAGYPGWGGYGASKAALDLVSLTLAHELHAAGVAVVSVDPGDMRTEMHQAAFPGEDIGDRPAPEVTLPFWAWLFGQNPMSLTGGRFRAQAERWEAPHAE